MAFIVLAVVVLQLCSSSSLPAQYGQHTQSFIAAGVGNLDEDFQHYMSAAGKEMDELTPKVTHSYPAQYPAKLTLPGVGGGRRISKKGSIKTTRTCFPNFRQISRPVSRTATRKLSKCCLKMFAKR